MNSIGSTEYFDFENSFKCASNWLIVTLVEGYLDTPNLWYINTTAEFLMLLA